MSMLQHGLSEDSSYTINQSLRFRASNSAYLSRTPASAASNLQVACFSYWIKRGAINTLQILHEVWATTGSLTYFDTNNKLNFYDNGTLVRTSTQVFRDPSAWYHITEMYDSTQSAANDRIKIWVNGVLITIWDTNIVWTQNYNFHWGTAISNYWMGAHGGYYCDGYLSETYGIFGISDITANNFGQTDPTTGIWVPKKYTGTYGTNGFYLPFNDATSLTTLGYDRSGNGNNWTCNNISLTAGATYDVMKDSPTNGAGEVGNYATLNPLKSSGNQTITNADLTITSTNASWGSAASTQFISSGKWYCEMTVTVGSGGLMCGVIDSLALLEGNTGNASIGGYLNGIGYYNATGAKYANGTPTAYGATYTTNDIIGIALDVDASPSTVTFYKNNVSQGSISLNSGVLYSFAFSVISGAYCSANFGQRPFAYTPPEGFKPLHTGNLPDATPVTTSGTFTGNASTDGPCIFLNGTPTAMTINGNAVTFATHADKLAGGFKVRSSSASYNTAGTNTYSITTNSGKFKNARAQANP